MLTILKGIAARKFQKIMMNIQEKRIKKQRIQFQAALMSGSIRRVK